MPGRTKETDASESRLTSLQKPPSSATMKPRSRTCGASTRGQYTSFTMPWPIVNQIRPESGEVPTASLALLDHVGLIPGTPGGRSLVTRRSCRDLADRRVTIGPGDPVLVRCPLATANDMPGIGPPWSCRDRYGERSWTSTTRPGNLNEP